MHHHMFRRDCLVLSQSSGRVAVIMPKSFAVTEVPVMATLEAVAVHFQLSTPITLCSLYIPPVACMQQQGIEHVLNQLALLFLV